MIKNIAKLVGFILFATIGTLSLAHAETGTFSNNIESIDFSPLSGGRVSIRVKTTQPLSNPPAGFTLNNPARIALDFPGTGNGLNKNNVKTEQGVLKSVTLAQAKDRTRMVLNLSKAVGYNTEVNGNDVLIVLQGAAANVATTTAETRFAEAEFGGET
ncbi:MAG TPA: AMIN domain-containing protein, partial [Methylophilaceae bacterium]|nr:AMIN domain-containing protein [Methylophilaceae bacterium]